MTENPSLPRESDWAALQGGASMLFGLLGRILFSFPDRDLLEAVLQHDLFEEVPFAAGQPEVAAGLATLAPWSHRYRAGLTQEGFDDLRADYTRLFVGPDHVLAPPWESVHRSVDGLLFQEQTLQVREWYRRFGLEVADLHREPDDHVGLELTLLSHLAGLAAEAAEKGDETALSRWTAEERAFMAEHPIQWVPAWCEMVARQAQTEFYRGIALLVRGAVTEFAALLQVAVPAREPDTV